MCIGSFWCTISYVRGAIVSSKMSPVTCGHSYTYTSRISSTMWCMHILYIGEMRSNECCMCITQCEPGRMRNGSVSMLMLIVCMHVCVRCKDFSLMQVPKVSCMTWSVWLSVAHVYSFSMYILSVRYCTTHAVVNKRWWNESNVCVWMVWSSWVFGDAIQ